MSWGRLDDKMHSHPKIARLASRNEPITAWVRMISWSCDYRTAGVVPKNVALGFATESALKKLVGGALLEMHGGDYKIHDFAVYGTPGTGGRSEHASTDASAPAPAAPSKRTEIAKKAANARWSRQEATEEASADASGHASVDASEHASVDASGHASSDASDDASEHASPRARVHAWDPVPVPDPVFASPPPPPPPARVSQREQTLAESLTRNLEGAGDLLNAHAPEAVAVVGRLAKKLAALDPENEWQDFDAEVAEWVTHVRRASAGARQAGVPWSHERLLTELEAKAGQRIRYRPKDAAAERQRARDERSRPPRSDRRQSQPTEGADFMAAFEAGRSRKSGGQS